MGNAFQDIQYTFDAVGNVLGYENTAYGHTTGQNYAYDGLYQLIEARGVSRSHPYGSGTEYTTDYQQDFSFNKIGNMTNKTSKEYVSNTNRIGVNLNYTLDYAYYAGTHMAERIGNRYYDYDKNGNLIAEREGGHAVTPEVYRPYYQDGDLYYTEYGFGLVKPNAAPSDDGVYRRNYRWNERNLLSESSDSIYTVQYRYGADGQRALKFTANTGRSTAYFNKMWQVSDTAGGWLQSKHIYVNEDRITTKYNSENNNNTAAEKERTYYYHSDHLGSAQTVTNYKGQVHERLEYTPYGELWIDWRSDLAPEDATPFRFTGKELDAETGLYYYGARYLDPKTSRWLSGDPAMGEYFPSAPVNDEARKRNGNLPGQGGVFNYVNLHAYHYAGNNPVKYVDPDGENFYNNSGEDKVVRTEGGDYRLVHPGEWYKGNIDGVISKDGTVNKVSDIRTRKGPELVMKGSKASLVNLGSRFKNWLGDLIKKIFYKDKLLSGEYKEGNGVEELDSWRKKAGEIFNDPNADNEKELRYDVNPMTKEEHDHVNKGKGKELEQRVSPPPPPPPQEQE
jgi:RHS repeat-associated protein